MRVYMVALKAMLAARDLLGARKRGPSSFALTNMVRLPSGNPPLAPRPTSTHAGPCMCSMHDDAHPRPAGRPDGCAQVVAFFIERWGLEAPSLEPHRGARRAAEVLDAASIPCLHDQLAFAKDMARTPFRVRDLEHEDVGAMPWASGWPSPPHWALDDIGAGFVDLLWFYGHALDASQQAISVVRGGVVSRASVKDASSPNGLLIEDPQVCSAPRAPRSAFCLARARLPCHLTGWERPCEYCWRHGTTPLLLCVPCPGSSLRRTCIVRQMHERNLQDS